MYIEPGVLEAAKHAGIKQAAMIDANHDGKLDSTDLNIARPNSHQDLTMGTDAKAMASKASSNMLKASEIK